MCVRARARACHRYDFKAHSSDCALLLSSPRGASRKDIAKKVEMELEQEVCGRGVPGSFVMRDGI